MGQFKYIDKVSYSNVQPKMGQASFPVFGNFTGDFAMQPAVPAPIFCLNSSASGAAQGIGCFSYEDLTNNNLQNKSAQYGYGPQFLDKVKSIATRIKCDYRDLLAIMNAESGINSKAVNKSSNATGLIQFLPSTARNLGTSVSALKNMSPIEQLDYVEKYLVQMKKSAGFKDNENLSGGQLYALVFLPARAKNQVLAQSGDAYYRANKGLDLNSDGKITQAEMQTRVNNCRVSNNSFLA